MAAGICLMKDTADAFIQAVKDGKIDPGKLADMSSAERNAFFEQIVGKNHATAVNSLFESKLLLKNQKAGMVTWAKQVSGIKPQARRDLIAKIERMQTVLDPAEKKQFLHDLTATRLGVDVTQEEAKNIADLSKRVSDLQALQRPDKTFPSEEDRLNYGRAVEDLTDYVSGLKQGADKIKLTDLNKGRGLIGKFVSRTAGNLKSIQASMDDSAIFRQGWKVMFAHPGVWAKNAAGTFTTMAKTVGGQNVLREVNADIISRPTYDYMVRAKLAIKNAEEAFPESLAEKVPALGRLYKASEAAFTAFQYKNRADIFDKYLQIAKANGVDIEDNNELKAIGSIVNSLTARGNLGKFEPVANEVNNIFFSPRLVKSQIDLLLQPVGRGGAATQFARRMAAKNLLKVIGGTAAVLAAADAILPGSVTWDPRSSDFGKIKVGNTRFDVTGGMGTVAVLAGKLFTGETKSTSTGAISKLDSGQFGSQTSLGVLSEFLANKGSPAVRTAYQLKTGSNFIGQKISKKQTLGQSVVPMSVQNFEQLKNDPNAANIVISLIADGLGISANDYGPGGNSGTSWSQSLPNSKELAQFKQAVGGKRFDAAAQQFDEEYNAWLNGSNGSKGVTQNPSYQKLSAADKQKLITKKKAMLRDQLFKANGFKYTRAKSTLDKSLL